jgi:hypothetical protein
VTPGWLALYVVVFGALAALWMVGERIADHIEDRLEARRWRRHVEQAAQRWGQP